MGILRTKTIEPATGSTLTLGASGDTITVSSDSIKANTFKDAGGNTLFTSDGAGTLSSVNSALAAGGPILISTATASGESSIEITSGIDSTYDEYMFVLTDIVGSVATGFQFQVNADGESDYNEYITSIYWETNHAENDATPDFAYVASGDQAQGTSAQRLTQAIGNVGDPSGSLILHLFNPSSTTYVKHFYGRSAIHYGDVGNASSSFVAGYINTTAAITDIQFEFGSGTFDSGVIQMYGIK